MADRYVLTEKGEDYLLDLEKRAMRNTKLYNEVEALVDFRTPWLPEASKLTSKMLAKYIEEGYLVSFN